MDLRSNFRAQSHNASTRRAARPQPKPAQRDGLGITLGGNPLRAQNVSNEALGTGDGVFVAADSGVVQQERRKINKAEGSGFPTTKIGRVKILVKVETATSIQFWVGGHIKNPILAKEFPLSAGFVNATLENTGRGRTKYTIAYKITPNTYTPGVTPIEIGVIYGDAPDNNWDLTDSRNFYLSYAGNGFWRSNPQFLYLNNEYANEVITTQPLNVGGYFCANFGIFSCKGYTLNGPSAGEGFEIVSRSGLPSSLNGTIFQGATSTFVTENRRAAGYDGTWGGANEPDFPDDLLNDIYTSEKCTLPPFIWQEDRNGLLIVRDTNSRQRILSSTGFAFSANAGTLTQSTGSHNINYFDSSINQPEVTGTVIQQHTFVPIQLQGAPQCTFEYRQGLGTARTVPEFIENIFEYNLTQSIQLPVAPGRSQPHSFVASDSFEISTVNSVKNFEGGYLFRRDSGDGIPIVSPSQDLPNLIYQNSSSTFYIDYLGQEYAFPALPAGNAKVIDSEDFPSIVRIPSLQSFPDNSVFIQQSELDIKVFRRAGAVFQGEGQEEVRAEKIYSITLPSGSKQLQGADYF